MAELSAVDCRREDAEAERAPPPAANDKVADRHAPAATPPPVNPPIESGKAARRHPADGHPLRRHRALVLGARKAQLRRRQPEEAAEGGERVARVDVFLPKDKGDERGAADVRRPPVVLPRVVGRGRRGRRGRRV